MYLFLNGPVLEQKLQQHTACEAEPDHPETLENQE